MDIYQKKALGVAAIASALAFVCLIVLLKLSLLETLIVAVCVITMAVILLYININLAKQLNNTIYPDNEWYRQNLERNFDAIILGDDIARDSLDIEPYKDKKIFDLSRKGQNINIDFIVLKNTFSILKPHGEVIIPLREASCKYAEMGFEDERMYYWALSPYVFDNSKISCMLKKIYRRIPILMIRWKDVSHFISNLCSKNIHAKIREKQINEENKWLQNIPCRERKRLERILETRINEIENFCERRDMNLKILKLLNND